MRMPIRIVALATCLIGVFPAVAGEDGKSALVAKVRSEAGWKGVEVERIHREGQSVRVVGVDGQGRTVVMKMTCESIGVNCRSPNNEQQVAFAH